MDEVRKQLLRDTRTPLPMSAAQPERIDDEYERGGGRNLFLFCEPLGGQRWADVTAQRTKADWAHQIQDLVDVRHPQAERMRLVLDNLTTHTPAALYEVFAPAEAKRIADKLEIHSTPKHGSWLNIAQAELSGLSRPCLDHHFADAAACRAAVTALQDRRTARAGTVSWRFTMDDARIKLKRLYPSIQEYQNISPSDSLSVLLR